MEKGLIGGQYKPLSQDVIGRIHSSALRVLEEVGVKVSLSEALEVFSRAGANVDTEKMRVRIPTRLVEKCIGLAPSTVILYGRKPKNRLILENTRVYMGTGGGSSICYRPVQWTEEAKQAARYCLAGKVDGRS